MDKEWCWPINVRHVSTSIPISTAIKVTSRRSFSEQKTSSIEMKKNKNQRMRRHKITTEDNENSRMYAVCSMTGWQEKRWVRFIHVDISIAVSFSPSAFSVFVLVYPHSTFCSHYPTFNTKYFTSKITLDVQEHNNSLERSYDKEMIERKREDKKIKEHTKIEQERMGKKWCDHESTLSISHSSLPYCSLWTSAKLLKIWSPFFFAAWFSCVFWAVQAKKGCGYSSGYWFSGHTSGLMKMRQICWAWLEGPTSFVGRTARLAMRDTLKPCNVGVVCAHTFCRMTCSWHANCMTYMALTFHTRRWWLHVNYKNSIWILAGHPFVTSVSLIVIIANDWLFISAGCGQYFFFYYHRHLVIGSFLSLICGWSAACQDQLVRALSLRSGVQRVVLFLEGIYFGRLLFKTNLLRHHCAFHS